MLAQSAAVDGFGGCVRIGIEQAARPDLRTELDGLLRQVSLTPPECDLILDLGAPNFEPLAGLAGLLQNMIERLPYVEDWRSVTVLGTSFPSTMAEVERGFNKVPRKEWALYQLLRPRLASLGLPIPRFGDYGIARPELLLVDPRFLRPSASVRYTTGDSWLIAKGLNVRQHKFEQYRTLCKTVLDSGETDGPDYSYGDRYIVECAAGTASTGNLPTWYKVGTNRHVVRVTRDLATLNGAS